MDNTSETTATETQEQADAKVERIPLTEYHRAINRYVKLWRQGERKDVAKVLAVDPDAKEATYELMTGPDKGKCIIGRFEPRQTVDVYDDASLVLALIDV